MEPPATPAAEVGQVPNTDRRDVRLPWLRTSAAIVGAVIGGLVIALAITNLFRASSNYGALFGALAWASFSPQIMLISALAMLLWVPLVFARRRPVLRGIASGLAVVAFVSSAGITGALVSTANQHGGSVDLVRAVTLATPSEEPDDITSYLTVDGETQEARVYEPSMGSEGAPVLMYIHGGGWYMDAAANFDTTARWYASQGWHVVSVDYRLASATRATWDKAPADVACALTWTAHTAATAGADANRLTVLGDSAGGHLAMLLGWSAADGAASSSCPELGDVPTPDAVVAGYPVSNIDYTYDNGKAPIPSIDPQVFTRYFLGGVPSTVPARVNAVSPLTLCV